MNDWIVKGTKDPPPASTARPVVSALGIEGLVVHDVRHVQLGDGFLTELLRPEWLPPGSSVGHVFQRLYKVGALTAWHAHARTTDRLFCVNGQLLIVLYDGRATSPTVGRTIECRVGVDRPALLVVPPGVWHALRNIGGEPATVVNMSNIAYNYDDPDHWSLPVGCEEIPYRFT